MLIGVADVPHEDVNKWQLALKTNAPRSEIVGFQESPIIREKGGRGC